MSRLSKKEIATIFKQDGQEYCICRSSDNSRFMIGCDGCKDWYHENYIGITRKQSKLIKYYFCGNCKSENLSLETIFKTSQICDEYKEKIYRHVESKRVVEMKQIDREGTSNMTECLQELEF